MHAINILELVLMTLTLMQGHSGLAAKQALCLLGLNDISHDCDFVDLSFNFSPVKHDVLTHHNWVVDIPRYRNNYA